METVDIGDSDKINAINSLNLNSLHGNTLTYLFFSLLAGFLAASNC